MKILVMVLFLTTILFSSPSTAKEATFSSEDRSRLIKVETTLEEFKTSIDKRFEQVDKRLEQMDKRFDDGQKSIDKRLDILIWILGVFVTLVFAALGFQFKMLYQQGSRVSRVEATVEAQKDEIGFLKELIGKLLPAQGREISKA